VEPVTLEHTPELYADVTASMADYHMIGWTVCGAEDPAVIELGPELGAKRPELAGFTVVRVIDRYVNCAKSDTFLHFSTEPLTAQEQVWAAEAAED
jgi:hypothetical protein